MIDAGKTAASHPGLVSASLLTFSAGSYCHLVASVSNVKTTCLPGRPTHPLAGSFFTFYFFHFSTFLVVGSVW